MGYLEDDRMAISNVFEIDEIVEYKYRNILRLNNWVDARVLNLMDDNHIRIRVLQKKSFHKSHDQYHYLSFVDIPRAKLELIRKKIKFKVDEEVQLKIAGGLHDGQWVDARITKIKQNFTYNIYVIPTIDFDDVAGFSGRNVFNIPTKYLRKKKIFNGMGNAIISSSWRCSNCDFANIGFTLNCLKCEHKLAQNIVSSKFLHSSVTKSTISSELNIATSITFSDSCMIYRLNDSLLILLLSFVTLNELLITSTISKRFSKVSKNKKLWQSQLCLAQPETLLDGLAGNFRDRSHSMMYYAGEKSAEIVKSLRKRENEEKGFEKRSMLSRDKYFQALTELQNMIKTYSEAREEKQLQRQDGILQTNRLRIEFIGVLLSVPCACFFLITLSLRADKRIHWSWYIVLILVPIIQCVRIIFHMSTFSYKNHREDTNHRWCNMAGSCLNSLSWLFFSVLLICKLARTIEWPYLIVFIPMILKYGSKIFLYLLRIPLLVFSLSFPSCKYGATLIGANQSHGVMINTTNAILCIFEEVPLLVVAVLIALKIDDRLNWNWLNVFAIALISDIFALIRAWRDAKLNEQLQPRGAYCMFMCVTLCVILVSLVMLLLPVLRLDNEILVSWALVFIPIWICLACVILCGIPFMCWFIFIGSYYVAET